MNCFEVEPSPKRIVITNWYRRVKQFDEGYNTDGNAGLYTLQEYIFEEEVIPEIGDMTNRELNENAYVDLVLSINVSNGTKSNSFQPYQEYKIIRIP